MKKVALLFAALLAYSGLALAVVNINSASKEQLETLEGVGPVKAQAIIDYRKKHGPFKKVDDIKKVDGIGDATYTVIKKDLVLVGTTTGAGKPGATPVKDKAEKVGASIEKGAQKTADKIEKTAVDTTKSVKESVKKADDKVEKKVDEKKK
jgi:competence protein ComEA